jgi:hypothetical protein
MHRKTMNWKKRVKEKVKLFLFNYIIKHYATKATGRLEVQLQPFLILAPDVCEQSASCLYCFTPGDRAILILIRKFGGKRLLKKFRH